MKISWPKGMERWKAVLDRYRYALLVIAAGVLLLLLPTGESRPPAEEERADGEVFFQLEELEEKLARTLSGIHGAGETEVMLTLKSGSRQVLAQDTQSRGEGERSVSTVTLGRGSGSQEVVPLQTVAPQFRGALVVCAGGSSAPGSDGSGQTGQSDGGGTASAGGSYFDTARLNRQQSRDSALALLQEAAGKESADQTLKDEANASIQTMADYTVTEAQIENLVIAKGYTDCVAFIGENALSLAVAAPEGGLTDADTARIVDVVNQTAGFSADQVKIIAVEE